LSLISNLRVKTSQILVLRNLDFEMNSKKSIFDVFIYTVFAVINRIRTIKFNFSKLNSLGFNFLRFIVNLKKYRK